ncbi:MAG: DUF115 domain-containing protein [Leptospiraceae bacterium]|nr:DUF115 domain-containing protein [Leptospiraceae bacterium]
MEFLHYFGESAARLPELPFQVLAIPYYRKKFARDLSEILKPETKLDQNTDSHFHRLWLRNYLINLNLFFKNPKSRVLTAKSLEIKSPIVFTGASPGLERDMETLKNLRNSIFLLASDSSLGFLLKNNLPPDAILSLDPGRGTAFHFSDRIPETIPILTWAGGSRRIFELPNPKVLFFTSYPLDQWLSAQVMNSESYLENPGRNIASLAVSISEFLGVSQLFFSGVSFLSEGGKTHCRGTGYESYFLPQTDRFHPLDSYVPVTYRGKLSSKNEIAKKAIQSSRYGWKTLDQLEVRGEVEFRWNLESDNRGKESLWTSTLISGKWKQFLDSRMEQIFKNSEDLFARLRF